jgi:hypothetical protein
MSIDQFKFNSNQYLKRNAHILGIIKKAIYAAIIVFLNEKPEAQWICSLILFIIFLIYFIKYRPYFYLLNNIGIILSTILMILIFISIGLT